MRDRTKKHPTTLVDETLVALAAQTITMHGTAAGELVIARLAANIKALQASRETTAG